MYCTAVRHLLLWASVWRTWHCMFSCIESLSQLCKLTYCLGSVTHAHTMCTEATPVLPAKDANTTDKAEAAAGKAPMQAASGKQGKPRRQSKITSYFLGNNCLLPQISVFLAPMMNVLLTMPLLNPPGDSDNEHELDKDSDVPQGSEGKT